MPLIASSLEVLDLWQPALTPKGTGGSFAAGLSPPEEMSVWRLDVSANPQQAQQRLSELETQSQAAKMQLNTVPNRLEKLVQQAKAGSSAGIAFSALAPAAPEADLLQIIGAMHAEAQEQVSFGAKPEARFELQHIGDQFRQALTRFFQLLTHLAWIETTSEGQLIGHTVVSWTGETRTAWTSGLDSARYALHQRNLTLALASRLTWLRTLIIATQGATKIGLLLGSTGGAASVVALPIAWKYVSQILAEIEQYKTVVEGTAQQTAAVRRH